MSHLSKEYNIHLFCFTSDKKELKKIPFLSGVCQSVHIYYLRVWKCYLKILAALLFSRDPLSNANFYSKTIASEIKRLISEHHIDLAYVFSSNVFTYVFNIHPIKKILHLADVDSQKWKKLSKSSPLYLRWLYGIESGRLQRWELQSEQLADRTVVCTEEEKMLFRSLGAKNEISVIKNGIDTGYFACNGSCAKEMAIVFTGVMNYFPNVDAVIYFYNEVYLSIKQKVPTVKFYIVGSEPSPAVVRLGRRDKSCIITGYVQDVRPYLNRSLVAIAPMRIAQGLQNKILEALAMELPVVTNSKTAEPISFFDETNGVVLADSPDEMANSIINLLKDPARCSRVGKNGRRAVIEHYSWATHLQVLDEMVKKAMQK